MICRITRTKSLSQEQSEAIANWMPVDFKFGSWDFCFYCGAPPTESDHAIPRKLFTLQPGQAMNRGVRCPACRWCNAKLSAALFPTLGERCLYVWDKIRVKHRKAMRGGWEAEDLAILDYSLRSSAIEHNAHQAEASRTMAWPLSETFAALAHEAYDAAQAQFPDNTSFHEYIRSVFIARDRFEDLCPELRITTTTPAIMPGMAPGGVGMN